MYSASFRVERRFLERHALFEDRCAALVTAGACVGGLPVGPEPCPRRVGPPRRRGGPFDDPFEAGAVEPELLPVGAGRDVLGDHPTECLHRRHADTPVVGVVPVDVDDLVGVEVPPAPRPVNTVDVRVEQTAADQLDLLRTERDGDDPAGGGTGLQPEQVVEDAQVVDSPRDEVVDRHLRGGRRVAQPPSGDPVPDPLPVRVGQPVEDVQAKLGHVAGQEPDDGADVRLGPPDGCVVEVGALVECQPRPA
jgi:hypothetical protein